MKSPWSREGHTLSFVKEGMQVAEKCSYKMSSYLHKQKEGEKGKKPYMCTYMS